MWVQYALILLFVCPVTAQQGDFSIAGRVVNSISGAHIIQALVNLEGPGGEHAPILADATGRFRFAGLGAGAYSLLATKPGYAEASEGLSVTIGPSHEDVVIRLEPLAVIKGRIVDSYGVPLSDVLVHALQPQVEEGRRRLEMRRWAQSNGRGDYRLWDLAPGRYYVKVAGRSAATRLYVGELPPARSDEVFTPVYYGGGQSAASTIPVAVSPGGEAQADFILAPQPGHAIFGAVVNALPYRPTQIEVFRGEEDAGAARAAFNVNDGRFRIQVVVDGVYTLRITQGEGDGSMRAVETVEVTGRDVTGLSVRLAPGVTVQGSVRVEGTLPSGRRLNWQVTLQPADTHAASHERGYSGRTDDNGGFAIPGVLPGRYRVNVVSPFGYTASITSGNKDLLADGELVIGPMQSVAPLEIAVRPDGGEVTGSVVVGGRPTAALVVLVPAAGVVQTSLSYQGRFRFSMVPPGEYRVHAFKDTVGTPAYAEPEVAQALSGQGERLQVVPNGKHKLDLTAFSEADR